MLHPVKRENYLVISAVGHERDQVLLSLSNAVGSQRCTILESRMTVLGEQTAVYMLVTGQWDAVTKLEADLAEGASNAFTINVQRTMGNAQRSGMPYSVNLVAADGPGIVHDITAFFVSRRIAVDDLQATTYAAPQSDTRIFSMNLIVRLPATTHLPSLREEFMMFCDERNLDAVIEPVRHP